MATTYEAIATVTVGSGGAANIEFTSIPGTYTDLCVVISARSTVAGGGSNAWRDISTDINGTGTNTNISVRNLYGIGSGAGSNTIVTTSGGNLVDSNSTANTFSNIAIYYPNYTSSNYKSFSGDGVTENNATAALTLLWAGLWSNTAAITSLKYIPDSGNFAQYSTATLYGIKNS